MFSGQGSQYFLMGKELYEKNSAFRYWMDYCSEFTESNYGFNPARIVYEAREKRFEPFNRSLHTSPAIFAISYSMGQALLAEGIYPDELIGYSLGELTALTMGGYLRLEDGLNLVNRSMQVVEERTSPAAMMAILGSPEIYDCYPEEFDQTTIASINFNKSFVITGYKETLENLQSFLSRKDILTQMLPVSHGFHSPIIDPAESDLRRLFSSQKLSKGHAHVVSSVYGRLLSQYDLTDDYFWDLVRQPVRFYKTVQTAEKAGPRLYIDAGPSGTLATFVKYILSPDSASLTVPIMDKFGLNIRNLKTVTELTAQVHLRSSRYVNL